MRASADIRMLPRVAVVVSHPIQHFCPLYRRIAASGDVCLKVYFASYAGAQPYFDRGFGRIVHWSADLVEGFDHESLSRSDSAVDSDSPSSAHFSSRLAEYDPDAVVVYGYGRTISRRAIRWAKRWHKKLLYISDAELRWRSPWWKLALKKVVLPRVFSQFDAFLTVGDCNETYYAHYGVDRSRFFRSPFPVDEDRLQTALQQRKRLRREIRERYELPEDALIALTVGKMTPQKRTGDATMAVCSLWQSGMKGKVFLLVVGDGPDREACERAARVMRAEAVRFAGFVPVTELPAHYVAADVLLHPSSADHHPLAISEAISCGLPCIVSDRVGSVGPTDDIRSGVNGWEYSVGDYSALASRIRELALHPEVLRAMSDESFRIGRERGMDQSLCGFLTEIGRAS